MQFTLGDKGEVYLLDESVLLVTEKEKRGEGKNNNEPMMKYVHSRHNSVCPYTKERCSMKG